MRNRTQKTIQAVLWDLDGTLVQTEGLHEALEREILTAHGVPIDAGAWARYRGSSTRAMFGGLLAEVGRPELLETLLAAKAARAQQAIVDRTVPIRGVEAVLRDIPMRTHRFALVTSSERPIAEGTLERLSWTWRFEVIVSATDISRPKPDPEPYATACDRLGLLPSQTLAVEDAPNGVRAAKAAGCRVAAIPGTVAASALGEAHYVLSQVGAVVGLLGVLG